MAEASTTPKQTAPLPHKGDHDRVAMLSVKADGTFDQHNPEILGDVEFATAATKRQFAQQAASVVGTEERGVVAGADSVTIVGKPEGEPDEFVPLLADADPSVEDVRKKQEAASKAAEAAAEKAVKALHPDA